MSQGKFVLDLLAYSDTQVSNAPTQRDYDWHQEWNIASLNFTSDLSLSITAGAFTKISLPTTSIDWLVILSDTTIDVVKTGQTGGLSTPPVAPTPLWDVSHAVGTWVEPMNPGMVRDGIYMVRGTTTDLYIGVPGANNAQVKVFLAY